jgi:hypothetical protein
MIHGKLEKPEGYHEHHRQKRRGGNDEPVNILFVSPVLHEWIEKHPEEAAKMGWTVSQNERPEDVSVVLPDVLPGEKPKRRAQAATPEERKARVNTTIKTPKGEENVIPELVDSAREKLAPQMGWDDDVPAYFVITAALAAFLQEA